jgi:hypothetical protein
LSSKVQTEINLIYNREDMTESLWWKRILDLQGPVLEPTEESAVVVQPGDEHWQDDMEDDKFVLHIGDHYIVSSFCFHLACH